MNIRDIHLQVLSGKFDNIMCNSSIIKSRVYEIINTPLDKMDTAMIDDMGRIIDIANIIYNQSSLNLVIDDDEYDILVERYKAIYHTTPIGSMDKISDTEFRGFSGSDERKPLRLFKEMSPEVNDYWYKDIILPPDVRIARRAPAVGMDYKSDSEQTATSEQLYPDLVGTLNKCKYTLAKDVPQEIIDAKNEKIFELDYIAKHLQMGLYDKSRTLHAMFQLKYDGISVVATVKGNKIVAASSRGDVTSGMAVDLTPILYGYTFDNMEDTDDVIGIKFEAIMTYYDLALYNQETGNNYSNCRTAITSIFGKLNGRRYQKYITLVPLDLESEELGDVPMMVKLQVLNQYYANTIKSEALIVSGTYIEILYQLNRFVNEAFNLKEYAYFMYDGVVFTYLDEDIVDKLGRSGSINQYQMAIKFPSDEKLTKFLGYSYKIGKDGRVTPMINYEPVIFIGTYHTKSSGHSYGRFKELGLKIGDTIKVKYVNDVMPYVTRLDCEDNDNNPNPVEPFISNCPVCGTELRVTESGNSIYCPNINCSARSIRRLTGFFDSLNIKDFSEAYLERLGTTDLNTIYNMSTLELAQKFSSAVLAEKFKVRMETGLNNRFDYELFGALGFTNIGSSKWKNILMIIPPRELYKLLIYEKDRAFNMMSSIKGVGQVTAQTILSEFEMFRKDIEFILSLKYNEISKTGSQKSVRFTGVRDSQLVDVLNGMGFDASGSAGVTKSTDILVVPMEGYKSAKVTKALENGTLIVPISDIKNNPSQYL